MTYGDPIMAGVAIEDIPCGSLVEALIDEYGNTHLRNCAPRSSGELPERLVLSRRIAESGLIVGYIIQGSRKGYYSVQLWAPEGNLWAEGSGESVSSIDEMIESWERWKAGDRW